MSWSWDDGSSDTGVFPGGSRGSRLDFEVSAAMRCALLSGVCPGA